MKLPSSFKNWLSITGAVIAIFNLAAIFALVILNWFFNVGGTYIGLFIYIVLPVFLVGGLIMIPIGRSIQKRRDKKAGPDALERDWPVLDFNKVPTRNAGIIFIVGTVFLLIISSIGSYEAYHYTESVEFCGKLCHKVMEPEYTAYHESSHERVKCVECHVGSGASWYVKSKMSGLYQVYSVLFDKYPRPIPTPIHNLRPARETCEECHWTEKFYDRKLVTRRFYMADDSTSQWDITLLMKTSATYSAHGLQEGIHWHINPNVKVEYKSDTADASIIPWVKFTNLATGETRIYKDSEFPGDPASLETADAKTMDCMDCHNRPSHNYKTPQRFVDEAITAGEISRELPGIKSAAMAVLYQDYSTKDSAFMAIDQQIKAYYTDGYPEVAQSRPDDINKAVAAIQNGYSRNIFPHMKVKWDQYPVHQSHMESNGCFRCHNNRNVSEDGHTISRDCQLCHNIIAQGKPGEVEYANSFESLEFHHPVDIDDAWKDTFCSECHSALF